jgi:predicted metal-dependent phosphoesterase TrpH
MIRAGSVRDFREAFERYLGSGRSAFIPKERLEAADAITIAHDAGGIAVWAHPGNDCRRERLEPLVAQGLDGVEIRHPSHHGEDVKRLTALTEFFGLVPSGGSDWHGSAEGPAHHRLDADSDQLAGAPGCTRASRLQPVAPQ